jgi:hypothetical protein
MSSQLFPEVIDASVLTPRRSAGVFLPIAVEGQADSAGSAAAGTIFAISREDESAAAFGPSSKLHLLVRQILAAGAGPLAAIASAKGSAPLLSDRQAAWGQFESDETIRLRVTDSTTQGDLAALASSVKNANLLQNKQTAVVGLPLSTSKANVITALGAIQAAGAEEAQRTIVACPGTYDKDGTLRDGSFTAATIAAEMAKNADPSNDLDNWPLPFITAVEKASNGLPWFRRKVVSGAVVNEYEDVLQAGGSPVMPAYGGSGVMIVHLRMAYIADTRWDSWMTRIIVDQIFIDVRNYIRDSGFLRQGNTPETRLRIASGVEAILNERRSWIQPVAQADGTSGYNVTVVSSTDQRQITIGYEGNVVRGTSTFKIAPTLVIAV